MQLELGHRHVVLQDIFNFRDLGGYQTSDGSTVRWRQLFRADGIHRLAGDDIERVRVLNLRTVIDLRTPGERADRGSFPVEELPASYHHLPVLESVWDQAQYQAMASQMEPAEFLSARYEEMLASGGTAIARALRVLADPDSYPIVFHCAAGKDRTGVLAALTLALLGVSDGDIAEDYALSGAGMERLREWIVANVPESRDAMVNQPTAFLEAPPEAIHRLLSHLRERHGSVAGYVRGLGVDPATIDAIRSQLLI